MSPAIERIPDALQHFRRSLAIAQAEGDHAGEAGALNRLGELLRQQGHPAEAAAAHRAALAVAAAGRSRPEEASAHLGLANALHDAGDTLDARRHWAAALRLHTDPAGTQAAAIRARLRQSGEAGAIDATGFEPCAKATRRQVTAWAGRPSAAPRA
ncbi:tetratricopeptide repeat protein [Allorhizocola rhizosphaerae]|uniref:tetratricopeptide repeat protein n=1 Tax=Allorhizocola rhizosphaerae TaxID=1872709 RepID=UPI0013C36E57|nr:tetratricopeptide repeat protein [Allorhizocola rhizosphaerae]